MNWIELSVEVEPEAVEPVSELLGQLGHGGIAIEQPVAEGTEPGHVEFDLSRPMVVKTYLPENDQAEDTVRRAETALWHLSQLRRIEPLRVSRLAEEDWAETWKRFFFVQRIGERLTVRPSWREYDPAPGEVVLELDPGMAFGTGLHPTTRMCLRACERYVASGCLVLDVGTGSGILAIAAARLGAGSVVAVDVDPVAVDAARKNVVLNGLEGRVQVLDGSIERILEDAQHDHPVAFDLILANIIASVIADLARGFHGLLLPGGLLVASGIIAERETLARRALEDTGLRVEETMVDGDWRTVVCRRVRA